MWFPHELLPGSRPELVFPPETQGIQVRTDSHGKTQPHYGQGAWQRRASPCVTTPGKHITVTWGYSRVPLPSQAYLGPHSHKNPTTKNHPIWILSFPVFLNDVCLYCPRTLCWHSSSLEIGRFHPIDFWLLSILPRYHLMVLFFASNGVLFSGYRFKFLGLPSF